MDKQEYIQRAKDRKLLNRKVTITFGDGSEQTVDFRGMHQEDNGALCAVVGTMPREPYCCALIHFSRVKELMADELPEDESVWGRESGRMWKLVRAHLEGVERAMRRKDELSAFRIAGDAVSCLLDAIRFAKDGR